MSPSCILATRWMFGSEYPAGNYKGVANVRWTCNAPCTSRNYLIQVLLPAPPMQLAVRRGSLTLQGTPALAGLACMDCPPPVSLRGTDTWLAYSRHAGCLKQKPGYPDERAERELACFSKCCVAPCSKTLSTPALDSVPCTLEILPHVKCTLPSR
jgi:hypothetical protein